MYQYRISEIPGYLKGPHRSLGRCPRRNDAPQKKRNAKGRGDSQEPQTPEPHNPEDPDPARKTGNHRQAGRGNTRPAVYRNQCFLAATTPRCQRTSVSFFGPSFPCMGFELFPLWGELCLSCGAFVALTTPRSLDRLVAHVALSHLYHRKLCTQQVGSLPP